MAELEIKGNKKYIKYLEKHLIKEHPRVKGNIKSEVAKMEYEKKKKRKGKKRRR